MRNKNKIFYPILGGTIAVTTTAAIAVPLVVKSAATKKIMGILESILPLNGANNSLKDNQWVKAKGGKVNYVAIGDSITSGYNGYMSSNDAVLDKIINDPNIDSNTKSFANEIKTLNREIAKIQQEIQSGTLQGADLQAKTALLKQKQDVVAALQYQVNYFSKYTTGDNLSYADFIASDLQKAGRLHDYRNYAVTGFTIPDLKKTVLRDTSALAALENADLISLSIGANDLLAAIEVLRLSFNGIRGGFDTSKVTQFNAAREAIDRITSIDGAAAGLHPTPGEHRHSSPSAYASDEDLKTLIKESFYKLVNMLNAGNLTGLFDMQQKLLDNIFDLIKLDVATTIKEIHGIAPDAKIVVMGYPFPFHLVPDSVQFGQIPNYNEHAIDSATTPRSMDGNPMVLKSVFNKLVSSLQEAVEKANYVKFFNVNDLREFSDKSDTVTYTLAVADGKPEPITESEWNRVMPNPIDIHPSTYGHQIIAGYLYEWIARDLGLTVPDYETVQKPNVHGDVKALEAIYTYAGIDKEFPIEDEKVEYRHSTLLKVFDLLGQAPFLRSMGSIIGKLIDPEKAVQQYTTISNIYSDSSKNIFIKIKEILALLPNMVHANQPMGNVPGYNAVKFVTALSDLWNSCDFSFVPLTESFLPENPTAGQKIKVDKKEYTYTAAGTNPNWAYENKDLDVVVGTGNAPQGWYSAPMYVKGAGQDLAVKLNEDKPFYGKYNSGVFYRSIASASDIIPNLTGSAFNIHGIKLVEFILGTLMYLSADEKHLGAIDRSKDPLYEDFKTVILAAANTIVPASTGSIADLLTFTMVVPLIGNGVKLSNGQDIDTNIAAFIGEIQEVAKSFGFDISSIMPSATAAEDWVMNTFLGDQSDPAHPKDPLLTIALKAWGIK